VPPFANVLRLDHAGSSQYAALIARLRAGERLAHGLAVVSGSGTGFQGFHGRSWEAVPGNVHLSLHLAPDRPIERFESVFMALAAVSVLEAIDAAPGLADLAAIRWVNDVLIRDAKVAGVLAHTQTRGATVTAVVLGIGINVETAPLVPPTPFVPRAASLRDFAPRPAAVERESVLTMLLAALERNYALLLSEGYGPIVERYRARSLVLGRSVVVSADHPDQRLDPVARGRVTAIGDGLELHLEGEPKPVWRGRLLVE
jgi:BirA family transcriptional regulator, biotin operon repressor / biotin---[acetyl-CoA-carboxylase] ligase